MTVRWMLPLLGLALASCATTSPDTRSNRHAQTPPSGLQASARSSAATVDEHLFTAPPQPGRAAGEAATCMIGLRADAALLCAARLQ